MLHKHTKKSRLCQQSIKIDITDYWKLMILPHTAAITRKMKKNKKMEKSNLIMLTPIFQYIYFQQLSMFFPQIYHDKLHKTRQDFPIKFNKPSDL